MQPISILGYLTNIFLFFSRTAKLPVHNCLYQGWVPGTLNSIFSDPSMGCPLSKILLTSPTVKMALRCTVNLNQSFTNNIEALVIYWRKDCKKQDHSLSGSFDLVNIEKVRPGQNLSNVNADLVPHETIGGFEVISCLFTVYIGVGGINDG